MKNSSEILIDKTFPSDNSRRKDHLDDIFSAINKSGRELNITLDELYLTLDEAVTNAMEHGNNWNPEKNVHVKAEIQSNTLIISISDEGAGFDSQKVMDQIQKRNVLSSRGRGIYIINQFSTIKWNEQGNTLELHISLK